MKSEKKYLKYINEGDPLDESVIDVAKNISRELMKIKDMPIKSLKNTTQHHFNEMHVYCRLIDLGFNKETAKKLSRILSFPAKMCYKKA